MLPPHSLVPLALFTLLMFAAALYALAALGHFPQAARKAALIHGLGPAVLWGSIAIVLASVAIALIAAWLLIPWYAAVIAGGVAVLVAPLALQYFSDDYVDGRSALLTLAAFAAFPAAGLLCYIGG